MQFYIIFKNSLYKNSDLIAIYYEALKESSDPSLPADKLANEHNVLRVTDAMVQGGLMPELSASPRRRFSSGAAGGRLNNSRRQTAD